MIFFLLLFFVLWFSILWTLCQFYLLHGLFCNKISQRSLSLSSLCFSAANFLSSMIITGSPVNFFPLWLWYPVIWIHFMEQTLSSKKSESNFFWCIKDKTNGLVFIHELFLFSWIYSTQLIKIIRYLSL